MRWILTGSFSLALAWMDVVGAYGHEPASAPGPRGYGSAVDMAAATAQAPQAEPSQPGPGPRIMSPG